MMPLCGILSLEGLREVVIKLHSFLISLGIISVVAAVFEPLHLCAFVLIGF